VPVRDRPGCGFLALLGSALPGLDRVADIPGHFRGSDSPDASADEPASLPSGRDAWVANPNHGLSGRAERCEDSVREDKGTGARLPGLACSRRPKERNRFRAGEHVLSALVRAKHYEALGPLALAMGGQRPGRDLIERHRGRRVRASSAARLVAKPPTHFCRSVPAPGHGPTTGCRSRSSPASQHFLAWRCPPLRTACLAKPRSGHRSSDRSAGISRPLRRATR